MNPLLHETIAKDLKARIVRDKPASLPSITELARQFGVSSKTMWYAVRLLARQGILDCRKGRRILVAGAAKGSDNSSNRLYDKIRSEINGGRFLSGDPLPKFDYFQVGDRVSRDTVAVAVRRLAAEQCIHKRGRRWFIGPQPVRQSALSPGHDVDQAPVVIVLVPTEFNWYYLFDNKHTGSFASALGEEFLKHGIRLMLMQKQAPHQGATQVPAGIDEVRSHVRSFGDRYLGGVIIEIQPQLDEFAIWAQELSCRGKKPVAWFDSTGDGASFSRRASGIGDRFFRMHFDHPAAVQLAVEHLAHFGHRRIGMPLFGEISADWTHTRIALAHEAARRLGCEIVTNEHTESFWVPMWQLEGYQRFETFGKRVADYVEKKNAGKTGRRTFQQQLMDATPSMVSLMREKITAIISLNDYLTHLHYLWLRMAGIEVPRHLSLISFDNIPETVFLPITTIDFGFSRLGYLAAHAMINDITIAADRDGAVPGICTLVNRGSVGRPGSAGDVGGMLA
jgi:hypothetical protein